MTQDEQKHFDQLQAQLDSIRVSAEQTRSYFSRALGKLTDEIRLYRGLFWCALILTAVASIINLLRR